MITLRPYQQRAMDQLLDWFRNNQEGHCIVSACVGRGSRSCWPGSPARHRAVAETRIIMFVPNKELLEAELREAHQYLARCPCRHHVGRRWQEATGHAITIATIGASTSTPPRLAMSTC